MPEYCLRYSFFSRPGTVLVRSAPPWQRPDEGQKAIHSNFTPFAGAPKRLASLK